MQIPGLQSVAMVDGDVVTHGPLVTGSNDFPGGGGVYGIVDLTADVDAGMEAFSFGKRIPTVTETGGDFFRLGGPDVQNLRMS